jgi:hypothetical protein
MDKQKYDGAILTRMAENEELVSELYRRYSEKFAVHKDFRFGLSVEEINHSTWILDLNKKVLEGDVRFDESRFNLYALKNFKDYMNEMIGIADTQEVTPESALGTALNIEGALIERKFFEVFESDSEELKQVLNLLAVSTKRHADLVREFWNKTKKH